MERYRRASARRHTEQEKTDFKTRLLRQSVACIVIFAVIFVIGLFKTETATDISRRIQSSLSYTVDYKATIRDMIDKFTKGTGADEAQEVAPTN